jgi:hypothetical protein
LNAADLELDAEFAVVHLQQQHLQHHRCPFTVKSTPRNQNLTDNAIKTSLTTQPKPGLSIKKLQRLTGA